MTSIPTTPVSAWKGRLQGKDRLKLLDGSVLLPRVVENCATISSNDERERIELARSLAFAERLVKTAAPSQMLGVPVVRDWSTLAYVYGRSGRPAEARHALDELKNIGAHTRIDPAVFPFAYAGTGDKEQGLATLDAAYAQHSTIITTLKVAPAYDAVRNEPRFQDLLRRLRF